jgi:hypothetical protein
MEAGQSLPRSQLPKSLLEALQQAGVVQLEKSGSSYVVRGLPGSLADFVERHWGIRDLAQYAEAAPDIRSRGMLADIAGDSKALPNKPLGGIFIRSFGNCFLADQPLNTSPLGSAVLVSLGHLPKLRIDAPHLIAVENVECLWKFEIAQSYFPVLSGLNFALALRWHWGSVWRQWLKGWPGKLLYFPDYDPAGLRIFATEVLAREPNAQLLVPQDFEAVLEQRGKRELYLKQEKYLNLVETFEHQDLARVCRALRKTRKALEQEKLLS